jgi:hypothetical protein
MAMHIISAGERMKEIRGRKVLINGVPGVGKTSLLSSLPPETTLFLDVEGGDLAVSPDSARPFLGDQLKAETWQECRDLACMLGGPNLNLPDTEPYSQAHYDACLANPDYAALDLPGKLAKYDNFFIDSLSVASRWSFEWSAQQPEAFNEKGAKDTRNAYGIHGREMVNWINQFQRAKRQNVFYVCIIDDKVDDYKRHYWGYQMDGAKASEAIPGIVDIVLTMAVIQAEDGDYRALISDIDNEWGYPAKDRSGKLDAMEKPDLGELLAKLVPPIVTAGKTATKATKAK